jgi:hypothetical protein
MNSVAIVIRKTASKGNFDMDNVNIAAGVRTALIPPPAPEAVFDVRNLNLWYGPDPALRDVTLPIPQ